MTKSTHLSQGILLRLMNHWFPLRPTIKTLISEGKVRQGEFSTKMGHHITRHAVVQATRGDAIRSGAFFGKGQVANWGVRAAEARKQDHPKCLKCRIWMIELELEVREAAGEPTQELEELEPKSWKIPSRLSSKIWTPQRSIAIRKTCGSGRAASTKCLCYEFVWRAGGVGWLAITS